MSGQEKMRVFELSDEQVAAIRGALDGCGAGWRLVVRVGEDWDEEEGHALRLLTADVLAAPEGIEGFELGIVFEPEIEVLPDLGVLDGVGVTHLSVSATQEKQGSLRDASSLSFVVGLQSLHLSSCRSLSDFAWLSPLTRLQRLDLSWCGFMDVARLAAMTDLRSLNLTGCWLIKDLSGLSNLAGLRSLNLSFCSDVDLASLSGLADLRSLNLSYCHVHTLACLSTLTNLRSLDLSGCLALTDISMLKAQSGLKKLDLRGSSIRDFSVLTALPDLQSLNLSRCDFLRDISMLSTLTGLQSLVLSDCQSLTDISVLSNLTGLQNLDLSSCRSLSDVSALVSHTGLQRLNLQWCESFTKIGWAAKFSDLRALDIGACGNVRDLDTLSTCAPLRELTWSETPACHAVLAATAVLRADAPYVGQHAGEWLGSIRLSKIPDTFIQRLVAAFALEGSEAWAIQALTNLVPKARERGLDSDGTTNDLSPDTWARWAEVVLALGDHTFRPAFEAALADLEPQREVLALLTPVLTALADIPTHAPDARDWALALVEQTLTPLLDLEDSARDAAPAAAVFYAAFGQDDQVRAWLDRGTHPHAPRWRDRVLVALQAWAAARGELDQARRWLAEIQTPELRDPAHAALARALATSAPEQAVSEHLEAIEGEALRAAVAAELAHVPAVTGTVEGLYGLLLTLQETPDALADLLERLVTAHPDSPLVADIARCFGAAQNGDDGPPSAEQALAALLERPTWIGFIPGRKLARFSAAIQQPGEAERLLLEALAQRMVTAEILDPEEAEEAVATVLGAAEDTR